MFQRFDADGGEPLKGVDVRLRLGVCDHPRDRQLRLSQRGGWKIGHKGPVRGCYGSASRFRRTRSMCTRPSRSFKLLIKGCAHNQEVVRFSKAAHSRGVELKLLWYERIEAWSLNLELAAVWRRPFKLDAGLETL